MKGTQQFAVNADFQNIFTYITKILGEELGEEIQQLVSTAVIQNLKDIHTQWMRLPQTTTLFVSCLLFITSLLLLFF